VVVVVVVVVGKKHSYPVHIWNDMTPHVVV